jgi:biotin-(acetyl-CoA carboxylase) ligase
MILLTDNIAFAQTCVPADGGWQECDISKLPSNVTALACELFDSSAVLFTGQAISEHWDYLFAVDHARHSQYDVLSKLAVSDISPPDKTLCCAASGLEFHGFKNRGWAACRGNIHLSAFVKPGFEVVGDSAGFIVAAALAALQTAESFDLGGAIPAIKWVNDILINAEKVGGVLARLQKQGRVIDSAELGIGLNVALRPSVERDSHVPGVAAISDFVDSSENCTHADAFPRLIEHLGRNLEALFAGQFARLMDLYRQHSMVVGHEVGIFKDRRENSPEMVAKGKVEAVGDSLELLIEGRAEPVRNGRLKLGVF